MMDSSRYRLLSKRLSATFAHALRMQSYSTIPLYGKKDKSRRSGVLPVVNKQEVCYTRVLHNSRECPYNQAPQRRSLMGSECIPDDFTLAANLV
jgi:hypothetical protein